MKALLCTELGGPELLSVRELPSPQPAAGEVRIDVHAGAFNYPDTLIIQGRYQEKPPLPFTPGCELAGVISAVGDGVDGFAVGDRVFAVPGWGAFAEQVVVAVEKVYRLPVGVDLAAAACLTYTYGTSLYALRDRAGLRRGETLLVLGAGGGTGLAVIELAKLLGARVIAAAAGSAKLEAARSAGADETVDYERENLRTRLKELTGGRGVDVAYDPVGASFSEVAVRSLAWGGRYLVIGFAAGEIARLPLNLLLLKGASAVGVFFGAFMQRDPAACREFMEELAGWLADGRIRPRITARHGLADAAQALRALAERRAIGKLILELPVCAPGGPAAGACVA